MLVLCFIQRPRPLLTMLLSLRPFRVRYIFREPRNVIAQKQEKKNRPLEVSESAIRCRSAWPFREGWELPR